MSFGGQITVESLQFSKRNPRGVYISAANYAYYNISFDSSQYTNDDLIFQIKGWEHGYDPCLLLNRTKGRQLSANMMK